MLYEISKIIQTFIDIAWPLSIVLFVIWIIMKITKYNILIAGKILKLAIILFVLVVMIWLGWILIQPDQIMIN